MKLKLLNIACGSRYHKEWLNIDLHPVSNLVKKVNILKGLPFKDDYFDAIYISHFIEHLTNNQSLFVLRESMRVLRQGGIIRIVVPDLENICREYLNILGKVRESSNFDEKYNWITVELLDQMVRNYPGGIMGEISNEIKKSKNMNLAEYILQRTGDDLLNTNDSGKEYKEKLTFDKLKNILLYIYLKIVRLLIPPNLRDLLFVNTTIGERHQWMYDSYSLKKLLDIVGFKDISIVAYNESNIPNFNSYLLDIKENGTPYKGISSLYVEARK